MATKIDANFVPLAIAVGAQAQGVQLTSTGFHSLAYLLARRFFLDIPFSFGEEGPFSQEIETVMLQENDIIKDYVLTDNGERYYAQLSGRSKGIVDQLVQVVTLLLGIVSDQDMLGKTCHIVREVGIFPDVAGVI